MPADEADPSAPGVLAFCVHPTDRATSAADLADLGQVLQAHGWEIRVLPPEQWLRPIDATIDVLVSLEPDFDPSPVAASIPVLGWVRGEPARWVSARFLPLYDGMLASSPLALEAMRRHYPGPIDLLAAEPNGDRVERGGSAGADTFLAAVARARARAGHRPVTINYLPPSPGNPYQRLLYAESVAAGARVLPMRNPLAVPRDDGGPLTDQVLHVHWTSPVVERASGPFDAYRRLETFRGLVHDFRARGGLLFWTVHNLLPHDARHRTLEIELARFLAEQADVIHVLGAETIAAAAPLYELPPHKVRVIEHSSYRGVYPDVLDRSQARHRLGLDTDDIALLMIGQLRPYKGLDLVLPVFDRALAAEPRLRLLVAGRVGTPRDAVEPWLDQCRRHPRVVTHFDFVAEEDLQLWLRAADLVLLPYTCVLNSGALRLAQTFGRPAVVPGMGVVGADHDPAHTVSFRPQDPADLLRAVQEGIGRLLTPEAAASALATADRLSPAAMSRQFLDLLREHVSDGALGV